MELYYTLKNGNIKLNLKGHKTDFFLLEKPITVDKHLTNPLVCPVKLLAAYMESVQHFKTKDSPLFSFRDDEFLDTEDVSQLIKSAMFDIVEEDVTVSGHSLRIGATTESIIKGVRWSSSGDFLRLFPPLSLREVCEEETESIFLFIAETTSGEAVCKDELDRGVVSGCDKSKLLFSSACGVSSCRLYLVENGLFCCC